MREASVEVSLCIVSKDIRGHAHFTQGAIFLHAGTMVNAPLCNNLYLFRYFLSHPYILPIFVENFH